MTPGFGTTGAPPPRAANGFTTLSGVVARDLLLPGAALVLFLLVFGPTFYWLWQRWTMSIWHNGHGMFVPFAVAYLVWDRMRRSPPAASDASARGFLLLIPAVLMVVIDSGIKTQLLAAAGLVLALPGISLLLWGWRFTRSLLFAWALSAFMLPIPAAFVEGIQLALRQISAAGSEHIVSLLGIAVFREHTTLHLTAGSLLIADACSGFAALYASVALAVWLAYQSRQRRRKLLLLAAAVPLPIFFNVIRCSLLALLVHIQGVDVLATRLHELSGVFTFAAACGSLLFLAGERRKREVSA